MEQINPINKVALKDKMKSYTRHPGSLILLLLVLIAAALTVVTLLFLVGYILISGIPYLKPSLFALHYNSDNVSMLRHHQHGGDGCGLCCCFPCHLVWGRQST